MAKQKHYYAIVHRENGFLLVNGATLPIYWLRKVADHHAKFYKNYIVQKVSIDEISRLILKQPNSKAI